MPKHLTEKDPDLERGTRRRPQAGHHAVLRHLLVHLAVGAARSRRGPLAHATCLRLDYTAIGDTSNVAARLQHMRHGHGMLDRSDARLALRATFSSLLPLPRKLGTKRGEHLVDSSVTVPNAKRDEARRNRGNNHKRAQTFAIEPNVHQFPNVAFGEPMQALRCIGGDADGGSIVAASSLDEH
jgi:hypothetical protein